MGVFVENKLFWGLLFMAVVVLGPIAWEYIKNYSSQEEEYY